MCLADTEQHVNFKNKLHIILTTWPCHCSISIQLWIRPITRRDSRRNLWRWLRSRSWHHGWCYCVHSGAHDFANSVSTLRCHNISRTTLHCSWKQRTRETRLTRRGVERKFPAVAHNFFCRCQRIRSPGTTYNYAPCSARRISTKDALSDITTWNHANTIVFIIRHKQHSPVLLAFLFSAAVSCVSGCECDSDRQTKRYWLHHENCSNSGKEPMPLRTLHFNDNATDVPVG